MARIAKATSLAGLVSGLIAPIIWPFVVLLLDGAWPTWSVYPVAALTISFFAIIIAWSNIVVSAPSISQPLAYSKFFF